MSKYQLVTLGKHIDILSGFAFPSSGFNQKNGVPLIRIRDILSGRTETYYEGSYDLKYLIKKGDLLVGMDGDFNREYWKGTDALLNQRVCKITPNPETLDKNFLYHFLQKELDKIHATTDVVTVKHLSVKKIQDIKIRLPSLKEQKRIAAILDKADGIRQKREQAIKLADDFLRATFLEMFGDPVMNPKGFDIKVLSDFFIDEKNGTKCGPFGSALKKDEYTREGVPVWNMDNITLKGGFIDLPSLWISEYKYQELESYSVLDGDVIISRAGTVGKMGVVRLSTEKSIISTNLIRVRFGEKLYPEYFVSLMTYCKGRVGNLKTGPDGTFTHMNTGVLSNLEFPYPPLELQKKYIKIRQSVMLLIDKYHHFGFGIDETFCAINQKAFLCQP